MAWRNTVVAEPRERRLVRHLVAMAAAVHQVGRAGGAHVGVVEALEHRRRLRRQVLEVHVVDRVGERLLEAERLRGLEAGAVLDVAPLAAVVPVHRRDLVPVGAGAGRDRGGAHGRDRRERGDAVVDVLAALDQQLQRGCAAARDDPLEHRGLHGVDDGEDELLHRSTRKPAYFSPSRRRPPISSHASAADHEQGERREEDREAGGDQRHALGVDRQRARRLGVQAATNAREQRPRGEEAEHAAAAPSITPGTIVCPRSASDAAASSAPSSAAITAYTTVGPRLAVPALQQRGQTTNRPRRGRPAPEPTPGTRSPCPSKSRPRFAAASAPARSIGSHGRTPIAAASPTPWSRSRTKSMR